MASPSTVRRRYAPFLLLAAVQAFLVAAFPSTGRPGTTPTFVTTGGDGPVLDGEVGAGTTVPDATQTTLSATSGSSPPRRQSGGGAAPTVVSEPGTAGGTVAGLDPTEPGAWPWTHPWLLAGDRSRCAAGGQLQQDVTLFSPPCVPRFTGDNGGSTSQGVTAEKVKIVFYRNQSSAAADAVISQVGLGATVEEDKADLETWGRFFQKHYELYGRTIEWVFFLGNCSATPPDPTCYRNDAREVATRHRPFLVFAPSTLNAELFDELTRAGIVNIGGWHLSSSFSTERRPYHYDFWMDGTRTARNVADYYCKKMVDEPASLAGDASMRLQRRKIGIVTPEDPDHVRDAQLLANAVSGGTCGSAGSRPPVLTYSLDLSIAQTQMTTIVAALKQAGATTVVCLCDLLMPAFLTKAADEQAYFPEHLMSGAGGVDYDFAGRLYSPTQWRNAFGPSHLAQFGKESDQDHFKAWYDVRSDGAPCASCLLNFWYQHLAALAVQYAGPNLTPLTVERGFLSSPQLGGWVNRDPWPGWVCCQPFVQEWKWGVGDYTATEDSKEVYWDPGATSPLDGQPGAYVCVAGCRRYEVGSWPSGDPKS